MRILGSPLAIPVRMGTNPFFVKGGQFLYFKSKKEFLIQKMGVIDNGWSFFGGTPLLTFRGQNTSAKNVNIFGLIFCHMIDMKRASSSTDPFRCFCHVIDSVSLAKCF